MSETAPSASPVEFNNSVDQDYFDRTGRIPPLHGREITVEDLRTAVEFARDQANLTRDPDEAIQLREEADYLEDRIFLSKYRSR